MANLPSLFYIPNLQNMKKYFVYFTLLIATSVLIACKEEEETVFTLLPVNQTGIGFSNRIAENDTLNIFTF